MVKINKHLYIFSDYGEVQSLFCLLIAIQDRLSWAWHAYATSFCLSYFSLKIYMKNNHKQDSIHGKNKQTSAHIKWFISYVKFICTYSVIYLLCKIYMKNILHDQAHIPQHTTTFKSVIWPLCYLLLSTYCFDVKKTQTTTIYAM